MEKKLKDMANAIRFLSAEAVQRAVSGHPGMPLGMADVATVLFAKFINFTPSCFNRDRFILSNGHGSMLIYSIMYLMGYLNIQDILAFRQLNSKTPGHPECGETPGIEMTTGPLGQGFASAVGFALAECILRSRFGDDVVSHKTYVMVGDGCLMEGISHEAGSLAGHLRLNNLIAIFDDNGISIDGSTSLTCSDDITGRFVAYRWNVIEVDGHDFEDISSGFERAVVSDRPVLLRCKTKIGYGLDKREGKAAAHSGPFPEQEIIDMRSSIGWDSTGFDVPPAVLLHWKDAADRARYKCNVWDDNFAERTDSLAIELRRVMDESIPESVWMRLVQLKQSMWKTNESTRRSSGRVLECIGVDLPELIGGSADLTGSNCTKHSKSVIIDNKNYSGNYIHYGIREHGMAACMNGMALHGGVIPYAGTFLAFADYCRPAIRLSALIKKRIIYVMTHDSIGLGEDGPTHQPVEHLASLRAMPNLYVFRPADITEVVECWEIALRMRNAPSVIVLSRQDVRHVRVDCTKDNLSSKGAYVLLKPKRQLVDIDIIATGSEVSLGCEVAHVLESQYDLSVRVISAPCLKLLTSQSINYIDDISNGGRFKVIIEAACLFGWSMRSMDMFFGVNSFGKSAPADVLYKHFGLTVENIVPKVLARWQEVIKK